MWNEREVGADEHLSAGYDFSVLLKFSFVPKCVEKNKLNALQKNELNVVRCSFVSLTLFLVK